MYCNFALLLSKLGRIWMHTPLLLLSRSEKVMFWAAWIYLFIYWFVYTVCILTTFLKNYWTELHEIFRNDLSSSKDQSFKFWERWDQRSRPWKGQKLIFVITSSVFIRFIRDQCQNLHFSTPYPLICHMIWWHHYSGLLVWMYVCYQLFSKTIGPNCMKFSGMICYHPRTNRLDFWSNQIKDQGQGHKKVKTTRPNCMQFSGMIFHHAKTNRLDSGSCQVKGQGHEKVKNVFLS